MRVIGSDKFTLQLDCGITFRSTKSLQTDAL